MYTYKIECIYMLEYIGLIATLFSSQLGCSAIDESLIDEIIRNVPEITLEGVCGNVRGCSKFLITDSVQSMDPDKEYFHAVETGLYSYTPRSLITFPLYAHEQTSCHCAMLNSQSGSSRHSISHLDMTRMRLNSSSMDIIFNSIIEAVIGTKIKLDADQLLRITRGNEQIDSVILGITDGIGTKWTYEKGVDWNQPKELLEKYNLLDSMFHYPKIVDSLERNTVYQFSVEWIDVREGKVIVDLNWNARLKEAEDVYATGKMFFTLSDTSAYLSGISILMKEIFVDSFLIRHMRENHPEILERNIEHSIMFNYKPFKQ